MLEVRDTEIDVAAERCLDELVRDGDVELMAENRTAARAELASLIRHSFDDRSARDLALWWSTGTKGLRRSKQRAWRKRVKAEGAARPRPSDLLPSVEEGRIELTRFPIPGQRARPAIDALIQSLVAAPTVRTITATVEVLRWKLGSRLAQHFREREDRPVTSSRDVPAASSPLADDPRSGPGSGSPPAEARVEVPLLEPWTVPDDGLDDGFGLD